MRKPTGRKLYAFLDHDSRAPFNGRKKCGGDVMVYDAEGRLVFCIKGIACIFGASTDTTKLSDLVWQPRLASTCVKMYGRKRSAFIHCSRSPPSSHTHTHTPPQPPTILRDAAACLAAYEQALLVADTTSPDDFSAIITDRLTAAVAQAARRFHAQQQQRQGGAPYSVFRVLECVEGSSLPTLAEALARMDLPPEQIVEVFVTSHDLKVLNLTAGGVGRTGDGLRVRKLLLPAMARELADYSFDVVALHDWHATGARPWTDKGPRENDPAGNAVAALESFLTPGAQVLALGVGGQEEADAWLRALRPLAVAGSDGATTTAVRSLVDGSVVMARVQPRVPGAPRTFLVLAEEASVGKELAKRLGEAGGVQCQSVVLTCGAHPKASFQDAAPATQWAVALGKTLEEVGAAGGGFAGVVFLAGLGDDTVLGTMAFGRLAKLCQAAQACEPLIAGCVQQGHGQQQEAHLWVVTEGAYGGTIRPNQGTMQGFTYVIAHELPALEARLVDMATDGGRNTSLAQGLQRVAEVLALCPREKCYRVSAGGVEVPRYFPVDVKARRSRLVGPLDKEVAYVCDVSTELCTPGQVRVLVRLWLWLVRKWAGCPSIHLASCRNHTPSIHAPRR